PVVRQRVFEQAAIESKRLSLRALVPVKALTRAWIVAASVWLLVSTFALWRQPVERMAQRAGLPSALSTNSSTGAIRVTVSLTPPAYTQLPATTSIDPSQIAAVEGTMAALTIAGEAGGGLAQQ